MLPPEEIKKIEAQRRQDIEAAKGTKVIIDRATVLTEDDKPPCYIYSTAGCKDTHGFEIAMVIPGYLKNAKEIPGNAIAYARMQFEKIALDNTKAGSLSKRFLKFCGAGYMGVFHVSNSLDYEEVSEQHRDEHTVAYFSMAIARHKTDQFHWFAIRLIDVKPIHREIDIIH